MKKTMLRRSLALLLALGLVPGLAGCGSAGMDASAAAMFLRKAEGTVQVADAEGQDVEIAENLGLYSGYAVGTKDESFAWIDLDKVKLAKLNENSEAAVTKEDKSLSIEIRSGSLFFNVAEPLAEDETMEISASSMLVGIRGTCGWVAQNTVGILEGTVTVTAGQETATVNAGEIVYLTQDGALTVRELTFASIPAFVARELLDDEALQQAVLEASGLYIPTTYEELLSVLEKGSLGGETVYSEEIDFEADGSPELLVISLQEAGGAHEDFAEEGHFPYRRISFGIYRNGPEGFRFLTGTLPVISRGMYAQSCSLVEQNGRLFLRCVGESKTTGSFVQYYGSLAERDGGMEEWGEVDLIHTADAFSYVAGHDENGFTDKEQEQGSGTQTPYTFAGELYRVDGIDSES